MGILVIDSGGSYTEDVTTVHIRNSKIIAESLGADLYYMGECNPDKIDKDYDTVVFVHSSGYMEASPIVDVLLKKTRKYFYITNEYNLGQSIPLWAISIKHFYTYEVIANHSQKANVRLKVEKPISKWWTLNLNTLIYETPKAEPPTLFPMEKKGVIYFGTFRKGRIPYFRKYFDERLFVSTSNKNHDIFKAEGLNATFIDKLNWNGEFGRLDNFKASLYIEDVHTHNHYNYLANRFYECVAYNIPQFFDVSCKKTVEQSGYKIDDFFFVSTKEELHLKKEELSPDFKYDPLLHGQIMLEKEQTLNKIREIIMRGENR